jgi:hypothetical protein
MKKANSTIIYVWIFWLSMAVMAVWVVLKAAGIINSPVWVELIPYASAIFAAGSFFQMFIDMKKDFVIFKRRVERIAVGLTKVESKFERVEKGCKLLKA